MPEEEIPPEDAELLGVWTKHARMENGERRFRLRNSDGSAYIRTEATAGSGWQKSHKHQSVRETYVVQKGRMALAELIAGRLRVRVFGNNGVVTTQPDIPHNVYMFSDAVIHTVKHGEEGKTGDWIPQPDLDLKTLHLKENEILNFRDQGAVSIARRLGQLFRRTTVR